MRLIWSGVRKRKRCLDSKSKSIVVQELFVAQENVLEILVLCYTIKDKYIRLSKGGI